MTDDVRGGDRALAARADLFCSCVRGSTMPETGGNRARRGYHDSHGKEWSDHNETLGGFVFPEWFQFGYAAFHARHGKGPDVTGNH